MQRSNTRTNYLSVPRCSALFSLTSPTLSLAMSRCLSQDLPQSSCPSPLRPLPSTSLSLSLSLSLLRSRPSSLLPLPPHSLSLTLSLSLPTPTSLSLRLSCSLSLSHSLSLSLSLSLLLLLLLCPCLSLSLFLPLSRLLSRCLLPPSTRSPSLLLLLLRPRRRRRLDPPASPSLMRRWYLMKRSKSVKSLILFRNKRTCAKTPGRNGSNVKLLKTKPRGGIAHTPLTKSSTNCCRPSLCLSAFFSAAASETGAGSGNLKDNRIVTAPIVICSGVSEGELWA